MSSGAAGVRHLPEAEREWLREIEAWVLDAATGLGLTLDVLTPP